MGGVHIAFSGGKDSTVLLHLVRSIYPNVKGVFVDTGLEFPEIKEFVKRQENIEIIRPEISFVEVIKKYGWVYPSKDVANTIYYARKSSLWALNRFEGKDKEGNTSSYKQRYKKWKFMINAPVKISDRCCYYMKKLPVSRYVNKYALYPYIGTQTEESKQRENGWLRTGCNSYKNHIVSMPLSFWTQQDILRYIVENNLEIASVYGEIKSKNNQTQLFNNSVPQYYLTGEQRTGCIFCPIGCHLEKENKFHRLKYAHPDLYDYCLNKLGLKELLDYVGNNLGKQLY